MKPFRHSQNRPQSRQGIALVITLTLLAVVTAMAVIFLGVSRRERTSVKVTEDQGAARSMADTAVARAQSQVVATIISKGTTLGADLFVTTNFQSAYYTPGNTNRTNVSYVDKNGKLLTGVDYLANLTNLQYDPRPPVFVTTNENFPKNQDFRYYLDFNRNRRFETNGLVAVMSTNGGFYTTNALNGDFKTTASVDDKTLRQRVVGDPEWIGVLERPDRPHSETNQFIGRYASITLPVGKTLDFNFIHNDVRSSSFNKNAATNGFFRNQGVGSWELNLAAFLRDLNTNYWKNTSYRFFNPLNNTAGSGEAFDDAKALLAYRYDRAQGSRMLDYFSTPVPGLSLRDYFRTDFVDSYGDGPLTNRYWSPFTLTTRSFQADDDGLVDKYWPGFGDTNNFVDVQELFSVGAANTLPNFSAFYRRLTNSSSGTSTYDRYTYYRMLQQIGVDSKPAIKGKIHLNFANYPGQISTNLVPWTAEPATLLTNILNPSRTHLTNFFLMTADALLRSSMERRAVPLANTPGSKILNNYWIGDTVVRPNFSLTNIQVYHVPNPNDRRWSNPNLSDWQKAQVTSNEYTAAIQRLLQVSANIYDSMTNKGDKFPYYPSVFRPIYGKTSTNVYIAGFREETNANFALSNRWYTVEGVFTNTFTDPTRIEDILVYGMPLILGAKKGWPAFNEMAVESFVQVSRNLEVVRDAVNHAKMVQTNQMYLVTISNLFGIEAWNSYDHAFPSNRDIKITLSYESQMYLSNSFAGATNLVRSSSPRFTKTATYTVWPGQTNIDSNPSYSFKLPLLTNFSFLATEHFVPQPPWFLTTSSNAYRKLYAPPNLSLTLSNQFYYYAIEGNRIVDFVTFDKANVYINIASNLYSQNVAGDVLSGPQQVKSITSSTFWNTNAFSTNNPGFTVGVDAQMRVSSGNIPVSDSLWRKYNYQSQDVMGSTNAFATFLRGGNPAAGYADTKGTSMQAPFSPGRKIYQRNTWQVNDPLVHFAQDMLRDPLPPRVDIVTPVNTPAVNNSNLGKVNERYNPWGGGTHDPANNTNALNMALKDPGVRRSDDWEFPADSVVTNSALAFARQYQFPSAGLLGQVHRGTPWQTIYMKPTQAESSFYSWLAGNPKLNLKNQDDLQLSQAVFFQLQEQDRIAWSNWYGLHASYPLEDRALVNLFTAAPNENAARGLLSVNQTNLAAWSAVMSGIYALAAPSGEFGAFTGETMIEPASPQLSSVVADINRVRSLPTLNPHGVFTNLGSIFATPALTVESPWLLSSGSLLLNHRPRIRDEMVERIPQQILGLLKVDEPRFVTYAFGQALKPAPRSLATDASFYNICTNYQVTGEVVTKTVFRVEGSATDGNNPLRSIVESFQVLPPLE